MAQQMAQPHYKGANPDKPVRVRRPAKIDPYQDSALVFVCRILGKFKNALLDPIVDPWGGSERPEPTPLVPPEDEPEAYYHARSSERPHQQLGQIRIFNPAQTEPIPKEWFQHGDPHRFVNQWMTVGASRRYGTMAQQEFEIDPEVQRNAYYLAFFGELVDESLP